MALPAITETSDALPERPEDYEEILRDIRSLLQRAQGQAYKAVDNIRVQTYWQIGERLVRGELQHQNRATYGQEVLQGLAVDLGISQRQLYYMVEFYRAYPILQTVSAELSWSHYVELLRVEEAPARAFYEAQTIRNTWGVRQLRQEIARNLYERTVRTEEIVIATTQFLRPVAPEQAFRDVYDFDFLRLPPAYSEQEMEEALMREVEKLLLELGPDFALLARQQKLVIDGQLHAIDLLFYHRGLQCLVLVDLKVVPFDSAFVGDMNKYLNWFRENYRYEWERDPIGLIICRHAGKEEVHYATGRLENRIFVAEYRVRLPSEEELAAHLHQTYPREEPQKEGGSEGE
jgi:predicted nuclease of restriction endonuclease-like (RecB) superfamily